MSSGTRLTFAVCALSLAFAGCVSSTGRDGAEIRSISKQWEAAFNAGDLETMAALYTEDARILPPNAPEGIGHDAVRASFGPMIDGGLSGTLDSVEAFVVGGLGYHVGRYTISAGGGAVDVGKFVEIWRLEQGQWKMAADIWNSDRPAGAPTGTLVSVTHEVADPERWLAAWSDDGGRHEQFALYGVNDVRVMQSRDDPGQTGLVIDVADMDAFLAFLGSHVAANAMREDGVKGSTLRFVEAVPD